MVETGLALGYGIIIDNELMHRIFAHLDMSYPESDKYYEITDTLRERWALEIDSWSGNETFLGVIHHLDNEDALILDLEDEHFNDNDVKEFLDFTINYGIYPIIANFWQPKRYLMYYYH